MLKNLSSLLIIKLLFCALFCASTIQLYSQEEPTIESLKKEINTEIDENILFRNYYELAKIYVFTDFDSAAFYYNKTLLLAEKQDNKSLKTEIYLNYSKLLTKQSKLNEAEINCKNAIEIAKDNKDDILLIHSYLLLAKIKISKNDFSDILFILEPTLEKAKALEDSLLISECYDAFGVYYFYSDVPLSIDYYTKSLSILEKYSESETLLTRVVNIGALYGRIGQNEKAIEYLLRGADIAKKTNQEYVMSTVYNNLAVIYFEMKDNEKSKYYLEMALEIAQEIKDEPMICGIVVNLGELYQKEKKYNIAMDYYNQGLNNPSINNVPDQKIYTLHNIATLNYDLGNYNSAIQYAENALSIANQLNITMHNAELYKVLSESYEKERDYKNAFENQKLFKLYNDSLFNINSTEKIAEIQSKYDIDKAEQDNTLLKKDNEIQALTIQKQRNLQLLLFVLLFLIFTSIVMIYLRMKKDRKINVILSAKNEEIKIKSLELEKANIAKDKFFSILAHDLRNPFNSILGSLEILYKDYKRLSDKERIRFINLIHESALSTNELLSNLLDWSVTQRGEISLEKETNNISTVIQESINIHKNLALRKEILIDNQVPENLMAFFDKRTIFTTINNLLNNAIKFTPNKGTISIFCQSVNGLVHISIKDTGIGIPQKIKKSLFQIDATQSRPGTNSESGTGLGLILCKEFIEQNDGQIKVSSEEGKGSCFEISIPISE